MTSSIHDCQFREPSFAGNFLADFARYQTDALSPIIPLQTEEGAFAAEVRLHTILASQMQPKKVAAGTLSVSDVVNASSVTAETNLPHVSEDLPLEGMDAIIELGVNFRPIFFQFKVPEYVDGSVKSVVEYKKALVAWPEFFRMYLRCRGFPNQHAVLCNLQNRGYLTTYATPNFWKLSDLQRNYRDRLVARSCSYFRPMDIGQILDGKQHHVSYTPESSTYWRFSDPSTRDGLRGTHETLNRWMEESPSHPLSVEGIQKVVKDLALTATEEGFDVTFRDRFASIGQAIYELASVAMGYFNCHTVIQVIKK
ncbi:hypothetical protein [Azospirillum brasilense]|uniref:hypothetical protein n=1 Tax=Azospirillum brasilense TaxID=192 RepID=UPI001178501D|nr:hypothetical protein [Azospirillum brasilense]